MNTLGFSVLPPESSFSFSPNVSPLLLQAPRTPTRLRMAKGIFGMVEWVRGVEALKIDISCGFGVPMNSNWYFTIHR